MSLILLAIVDFIPVILFILSTILLQRDLYNKMSKGAFALFCAGTIDICLAGFLKALYKLLYVLNICEFYSLNDMFFPVQSIGFILIGISIMSMLFYPQGKYKMYALTPVLFKGTMIFVSFCLIGDIALNIGLSIIAKKMNQKKYIVCFVLSCIFSLAMGYLSSKTFDNEKINWIAEITNVLACGLFFIGVYGLHIAGLKDFELTTK